MEIPGIKMATLSQLGKKKKELDFFNIIFNFLSEKNERTHSTVYQNLPYLFIPLTRSQDPFLYFYIF